MAEVNGKLLTCDRCGERIFLKQTNAIDCGFSDKIIYEDTPEGWYTRNVGNDLVTRYALLCPECNRQCGQLLTDFMGGRESVNDK